MGIEIVEAFRKAMIDVLVPEIRELRNEMSALRKEMNERFEALHAEMNERFTALHAEMNERFAAVQTDIKVILARLDVAERVARMEAILGIGGPGRRKATQPRIPVKPRRSKA